MVEDEGCDSVSVEGRTVQDSDKKLLPGLFSVVEGVSTEFLHAVGPWFTFRSRSGSLAEVTRRGRDCLMSDGRDSL